ncbi:MAG: PKD domain-containing protein [Bacteroidales bacterium]|nr:PKD domain-containing protein [Bacteroidales bacterium]
MKTFYRIFGGKVKERALILFALFSSLQLLAQPCATPPVAYLTGDATICQGASTDVYLYISQGTAPWRVIYSINGVDQPEISGIMSSPYIISTSDAGDYKLSQILDANNCTGSDIGNPVTIQVNPLPSAAGFISGSTSVCQLTNSVVYSVAAIPNATGYVWSVPTGVNIVGGSNSNSITVNFSASAVSGNISVYGTNVCGNGTSSTLYVTVASLPSAAGIVSGSSTVCQGQTGVTYSVNPINNATGYEWSLPTGATISSGTNTNTITVDFSTTATSGDVRVRGNSACGNGSWSPILVVTVNRLPGNPGIITGTSTVCQGQSGVTYQVPAISQANGYEWVLPAGATINTGTNTNQITVNYSTSAASGSIQVRGTNGCGAGQWSAAYAVTVNNLPIAGGSISGTANVCQNETGLVYSVAPIAYANSYQWEYPAGFTVSGSATGSSITLNATASAVPGVIRVRGINSCGNGTYSPDFNVLISTSPVANAGLNATVCPGNTHQLSGATASNYSSLQWTSSGDGSFDNASALSPVYTPGSNDLASGSVVLTLTANGNGSCSPATSSMTLTISSSPTVDAGPDASICYSTANYMLNGSASNYITVTWTALDGSGSFGNANNLTTTYTPSAADRLQGYVTLQLTAQAAAPCSAQASDIMVLTISPAPTANAGSDVTSCGTANVNLNGTAAGYLSLNWTTSGSGTFTNQGTTTAVYTPSAADVAGGSVTLTLTAFALAPCTGSASDNLTLTLLSMPQVNAGPDVSNCGTAGYSISGSSAANYGSLLWTSTGSGTFSNPAALHPIYTPSASDLSNGSVVLTLTATGTGSCSSNTVSDQMTLFINAEPTANAGAPASICEGSSLAISDATAANYAGINWTTSGTGTFTGNGTLTPTYTPSLSDAIAGSVNLTLTVAPIAPCSGNAVSVKALTIRRSPVVNAGADATSCGNDPYTITGAGASNYSTLLWTSSGSGSFVNPNILNATYIPGASDLLSGTVTLTITANGIAPCSLPVSDNMTLTIVNTPSANAGLDGSTCETTAFTVSSATAANYSTINWTTTGTGILSNSGTLTPSYLPSHNDALAGTVTLTLTASGTAPCSVAATDMMQIAVTPTPIVSAGVNFSVCGDNSFIVPGASAQYSSGLAWTSSGTGVLVNANQINPTYTPSAADVANGQVTLTLTATGNAPCVAPVSSAVLVTINQIPVVFAGNDITICEGPHNISGAAASNYSTLMWTSNGDGVFINPTVLNPIYTPGPGDLINGLVTLTLSATSLAPCTDVVSDNVIFNINPMPVAYAGPNATICEGGNYELINATATNYTSLSWSTSGSGNFNNMNTLNPIYTPSLADIANGAVTLTLTLNNPPCLPQTSDMTLAIRQNPVANAGTDAAICEGSSYMVNNASATNASSVLWATSGSGTLMNPTTLTPTYIPSAADIMIGSVQLTMTVFATAPCIATDVDAMEITITRTPTAFAGNDETICANQTQTIAGSNASQYSSLAWSTSGDGVLLAANTLYPTYVPGTIDESLGFAVLTLTAYGISPCTGNATDQMMLTVIAEPQVNAGPDIQICVGSNVPLISATAQSTSSVFWTTSGSGTFSDPTLVNPVYTPSAQDIANGSVILIITGQGITPCTTTATDAMILQISQPPVVDAGSDGDICETGQYYIFDASATDFSAITWTTMGDGSFSNHNSINPTYTPGPADIAAGSVLLYLNATSLLPCSGSVSDAMLLTIHPMPVISAGPDAATCDTDTYLLASATAQDFSNLTWTSSGSGWFSNAATLNPIYTPSAIDIINGSVTLTLTADGLLPCTGQVTDQMVLSIEPSPVANAGIDETICVGSFTITTASATNYNTLHWVSSGSSGTLLNANTITPTYMPSAADILAGSVVLTLTASANAPCAVDAVDQVTITIRPITAVSAGADVTICEGSDFTPNTATASNYASLLWTSTGSGAFINANTLTPTYTPSPADIATGWVTLTLTANSIAPCTQTVTDLMILTITPQADVEAGPNETICESGIFTTSGAAVTNHVSLQWSTNGTGTFADPTLLITTYTPSAADIANGSVNLTLTAISQAPCAAPVSDLLTLTIQQGPMADAGPDAAICESDSFTVSGASATDFSTVNWTTTGNGTFVDGSTLSPTYTPGLADIAAGSVIITLHAQPKSPCGTPATDSFILTINREATANAGADASVCEGTGLLILDATATHYTTLTWTTSGTGTFSDANTLNPTYFPSSDDVTNGSVVLTLSAVSAAPCSVPVTDTKLVAVIAMPEVEAGNDDISCGLALYNITGASASDYASLQWTTSGTGVFTNSSQLNPSYQPSAADLVAGSVTLTLTANSAAPCTADPSDSFVLTLQPEAVVDAGADAAVCEGSSYTVFDATAANYSAVNWSTNGSGVLVNGNSLTPTYTPSAADALAGTVTMILTSYGVSPCGDVNDQKVLTISPMPLVNAGPDAEICFGSSYALSLSTAQHQSSVNWATSGSGSFSNPTLLHPVYTPSAADLLAGQVLLTVTATATAPCSGDVSDFMILMFKEGPVADAGADATICEGSTFTVSTATATNYMSLDWTTSGSGSFTLGNTLTPTYTPGASDLLTGFVTLTLNAYGNPPCAEYHDDMVLSFAKPVTADAGADVNVCEGQVVIVADASAQHYASVNWTSSGTGILSNPTTLTPTYTPSAGDLIAGSVNLTLTAFGFAPCNGQASSVKVVNLTPAAQVNAGPDATLCQGSTFTVSGASASTVTALNWTSNGSGSFSGNGTLTPTYTPSLADFISGSVTLTLTGTATSPCNAPAVDAMILTLIPSAIVNAGSDATICETDSYTVSTASASNYTSLVWTSNGTGTLLNPNTLTPTYTPSAADIAAGSVSLTLTANSAAPCNVPVNDNMILTISGMPEAFAGADATICEGQQYTISGATATTGLTFAWTSNGTGSFLNSNTLSPTYVASPADILNGSVTITLSVQGTGACNALVTDDMVLTIDRMATADAGADAAICEGYTYTLINAVATDYAAVNWTTSGSGSFANPAIVNATYNPSAADIANGSVVLTIQAAASGVCTGSESDMMTLSFNTLPLVNAGSDLSSCDATITINGATASNYSSLLWTSAGTGTLSNATTLNPTYVPSGSDIANGFVDLTLTAQATAPCTGSSSDVMRINLNEGPVVNAGNDGSICESNTFTINGANASNASLITWSTSGTGTFSNAHILAPVYTPSAADVLSGSVVLTLTATPVAPCSASVSDDLTLTIAPVATAYAGVDGTTCSTSYLITGATASNYSSFNWATSGSGTFINQTTLTPTYQPSAADFLAGSVVLSLEVHSQSPCTQLVTDAMTLTLLNEPVANAGVDGSVCEGTTFMVVSASASNFSALNWTTSGSGTFSGQTTLNPVYTPSVTDIANGSVVLTLTATASSPCSNTATDQMTLSIQRGATANAGSDASVCEGTSYVLSGTVSNSTLFSWSSSGTGTFASGSTLTPTYTPSAADIAAGSVNITLTAFASAPCSTPATDLMILSIIRQPVVNAGADATSCGTNYSITTASASYYNTLSWSTTGTGTFINPNSINPTYVASLADIAAGSVTLTLTATGNSPCTATVSDQLVLSFAPVPTVFAGVDAAVCGINSYTLADATAVNYSGLTWSTSGSGTFSNTTLLNAVYMPSAGDLASGSVTLTLTATSLAPCNTTASDEMELSFNLSPLANAGPDANSCGTAAFQVTGATAANHSSVYWTHNGTGTIAGSTGLNPVYTPSQGDVLTGQVTLTLHVAALAPCTGEVTDFMVLHLQDGPEANAGADLSICEGQSLTLSGATATGYASLLWSTSGSGTFSSPTATNPIYYPGAGDIAAGTVNLTLTLQGAPPCNTIASDFMVLTIQKLPVANAGADAVCCGSTYQLINASALNYSSVNWTTSGTGFFSNSNLVNPVYTPSAGDITSGSVVLTLTVTGVNPCNNQAADQMTLTIGSAVTANAGADANTCGSSAFTVSTSSATNYSTINWTSSGTGTFANQTTLYPTYTPSAGDQALGSVTLTMHVQGIAPCFSNVQDNMLLTINDGATVNAGPDAQVCDGSNFTVTGASATNYAAISWSTTGSGTIISGNTLSPTYMPSAQDYINGSVILTLSAISPAPCTGNISDEMVLVFTDGPVANAGPDADICFGVSYTVTGASASGYLTLNWTSTGTGTLVNANSLTPTYIPSNGDRTAGSVNLILTVQGAAPCFGSATDVMTLAISSLPVASGTISGPQNVCAGQTGVSYSVTPVQYATGYNWILPSGATLVSGANTANIVVDFSASAVSGSFFVNATNACGNGPVSAAYAVTVEPLPGNPGIIMGPSTLCQNTQSVVYSVNPVTGATAYQWTVPTGASIASGSGTNMITVDFSTSAISGNITVTPQNSCGSGTTATLAVLVNPMPAAPVITASGPVEFCEGGSVILSATAGYASYLWSNGMTTQNITVNTSGTYSVVTSDVNGCASLTSNQIDVNVHMQFVPVVTASGPTNLCIGESVTLSAPTGYASYVWNTGQTSASIVVNSAGNYNVTVTDLFGCVSLPSANIAVTVNSTPATPVITASGPVSFCAGGSVTLSAPAGYASYLWSNGETTQSILVTSSGIFSVTVSTLSGCSSLPSAPVSVLVNPYPATPVITALGATTFCNGQSVVLSATAGFASYLWSNGAVTQNITVTESGSYTVVVSDAIGCSSQASAPVSVTVLQPATPAITANGPINFCTGGSVMLSAPAGFAAYLWSNGEITQNITVTVSGSYSVQVTDAMGCISDPSNIIAVNVYPPSTPPVIFANGPTSLCDGETVTLMAPAGYAVYVWSNGQTTQNIIVSTPGNYFVTVTDVNGCTSVASNVITVDVVTPPTADAGSNADVCAGDNYTINDASASDYSSLTWTSSGSGYFVNNGNIDPTYVPSAGDISTGSVILTLSAIGNGPCTMAAESSMLLGFTDAPVAYAGVDFNICEGSNINITTATASNYQTISWSTSGSGTFLNGNTLTPTYIPSVLDINSGLVSLTLTASASAPCTIPASDAVMVTIHKSPQAFAGSNTSICPPDQYTTLTATASNYSHLLWTTNGTGTFTDPTSLVTVYSPSAADIMNGSVTLNLTAYANAPCTSVSDDIVLILVQDPIADAGADITICEGDNAIINGTASGYQSIFWTTSGSGNIVNGNTLSPTYLPSATDIANGWVTLTLTANPMAPCASQAIDAMQLNITRSPQIFAGADVSLCPVVPYTTSTATASFYSNVLWSTNGTGTFSNTTTVVTTYTPSAADIANGTVTLSLTGYANSPCSSASDEIVLLLSNEATANAGPDALICEGNNVSITGASATNYQSLNWATTGTGTIVNGNSLTPMYIPSMADINNGSVILSLTATPLAPCANAASDAMTINISRTPQIFAGDDTALCPAGPYTTTTATASYYSMLQWTSNGTGTFSTPNALVTTYTPSASDIANGNVTLTLTGFANAPCSSVSDNIVITLSQEAIVNAGADATICEGMQHTISGASASNYQSISWISTGTGVIMNGNTLTPTYIPSIADITNGGVVLSLIATPVAPCSGNITDAMQLNITRTPVVFAGTDAAICPPGSYTVADATASYCAALLWSSSGTGVFSSTSTLVTIYSPSPADIANGTVTLTLTGYANSPCSNVSDEVVLYFVAEAQANAGGDAVICEGAQHLISGASASNYSTLTWTSSGSGSFVNNGSLTPTYIPSAADVNNGMVILTLTANPVAPCAVAAADAMILTIERRATANAGPNASTCYGDAFYLAAATASFYSDVLWTTSGTGTFTNPAEVNATYIPSAADLASGTVTLTLNAYGNAPCTDATDFMVLGITPGATVDAGPDDNICFGPAPVTGASATNYASLQWTVSFGTGIIINAGNIMPTYLPSAGDLANGYAILTLTVNPLAPCTDPIADNKTLTISETPIVDAGLDAIICQGSTYTINDATAANFAMLQWTTSGSGTWINANTLNPTYTPSAADAAAGSVVLTLEATNGSCPVVTDYMQLNIQPEVTVDAGSDADICEGSTYTIFNASAANYSNINWITSGSGTFSNSSVLNPVYTPSAADIAAGSVVLTITGISSAPCAGSATDNMTLNIRYSPVADAGTDGLVCEGDEYIIGDAMAYDYASVIWTSTGTGTFINGSSLSATYIPSPADIAAGSVTLTLIASNPPCADDTDSQSLTIIQSPLVNAGPDVTICNSCNYTVSGAVVNNAVSYSWSTTGTGTITNGTTLTPTYQPGAGDISNGSATLILTVVSASGCGSFSDEMVIFINQNPDLDFTWEPVCEGQPTSFFVDETMTDVNSIAVWHWNFGDGFYANVMNPSHTFPAVGVYEVTLTATDTAGYTSIISHFVQINSSPIAFFSFDTPNCEGNATQFNNLSSTENGYITRWVWNYGDGSANDTIYFPNDPNPEHTYANSGIFEVSLNVLNSYGCENTFSTEVTVTPNPVANFYYTTLCEDLLVNFQDASFPNGAGNIEAWAWNFDDPSSGIFNTSDLEDPQHIFSAPGTYNVTLQITNFNNCTDTITKQVTVGGAPAVEFTWQSSCAEALTSFFADATVINLNAVATFAWEFGDGGISNLQDPQHMYAAGGDYTVMLTITDTAGCSNTVSHLVHVSPLPDAYFSFTAPTCFQTETEFNDLSYTQSGYITEWEWIFGDGNSTTVTFPNNQNVSHQYAAAGFYNVTLNITTSEGCEATETIMVEVIPNPVANFINTSSCLGEAVEFTDLSQPNGGGQITGWAWDFGDPTSGVNNTSLLVNPTHVYAQPGTYIVSLIVTTGNSCADTTTRTLTIAPAPVVDFAFTAGCSNDTIQFTSSTYVNMGATLNWMWEFGDGTTSTEADPQHIYLSQGIYTVNLTITDTAGCTASISHPLSVIPGPQAMFSFTAPACSGTDVQFNDMSVANGSVITSWLWDFGDGNTQLINAPGNPDVTHVYANAGVYTVTLSITNLEGCDAETSMDVQVVTGPTAEFEFEPGCLGSPVAFTDLTSTNGGPALVQWLWNFGDPASGTSNTSNLPNPVHVFNLEGTYNVLLTVTSASGCTDTVQHTVVVTPLPLVAFQVTSGTCVESPVSFEPDATVMDLTSIASWEWNFGDGSPTSDLPTPTHTYTTVSVYDVTLTVTDLNGCINSITQQVSIGALPVSAFTFVSACADNTTSFTDHSYTITGEEITAWSWNFNDPNAVPGTDVSAEQNPVYQYAAEGLYNVTLTVTTENGCSGSVTVPVQVFPAPTAAFTYVTNACANGSVGFQDASVSYQGAITAWEWEFEPGYTSVLQNPNHIFFHSDSCYNVRLVVTDLRGCIDTLVQEVCVPAGLEVAIDHNVTCSGDTTFFNPVVVSPVGDSLVAFEWDFDDLASGIHNTSTLRNPAHYFAAPGSYLVSLNATDENNCITRVYQRVDVLNLPMPSFSYVAGTCDSTIYFTDLSNGNGANISSWIWNYGDGSSDTLLTAPADTNHFYATAGIFEVSLTTITVNGCEATYTTSVDRMPCITAGFTMLDTLTCERHELTFEDQSFCGNPINSWEWNFGDGDTLVYSEVQPTVTHIYQLGGTYNVSLVVTTTVAGKSVSDTLTQTVKVLASPVAAFAVSDVCLNQNTIFTDQSTWTESKISEWSWDFGDPLSVYDTTSMRNPAYLYDRAGLYTASLTVTNEYGCTDTISHQHTVHYLPVADFSYSLACQNNFTLFTDLSDSADAHIDQWWWRFSDSLNMLGLAGVQHPHFTFENTGIYNVELTIVNAYGCSDTITKELTVNPKPTSAFSFTENYENTQGRVQFINGSIGANAYEWNFGTGIQSFEIDPVIDFTSEGNYEISLITLNEFGCPDTLSMEYNLMFKGLWVPNAFSPNNPNAAVRYFKPVGINLKSYVIEVFDTWGNLLWTSDKLDDNGSPAEGWNGTFNGNLVQQDVYLWKARAIFEDGSIWHGSDVGDNTNIPQKTSGTVTLIR